MSTPIIIIGFGPAGQQCYRQLRHLGCQDEIIIYSDEEAEPYNRVHLTELFFKQDVVEEQLLEDIKSDDKLQINFGLEVTGINVEDKTIIDSRGETVSFHKLALATGSKPYIPRKVRTDLEGVFTYRNILDAQNLAARVVRSRSVAVLGGGLLGIEAAYALNQYNTNVTLVNRGDKLLSSFIDAHASELLISRLSALGITVILNTSVEKVEGQERLERIILTRKNKEIIADTLVVTTGIKPNIELAYTAPLDFNKGVTVNDHMHTSCEDIYAIGECAEHHGKVYGFVAPALEQANVAASDMVKPNGFAYTTSIAATKLKVIDMPIVSMGDISEYHHSLVYEDEARGIYRRLFMHHNHLVGAIGVGEWKEADLLLDEINKNKVLYFWERLSFKHKGSIYITNSSSIHDWPDEKVVCNCKQVTKGRLLEAVGQGCSSFSEISAETKASTVCGSCKPLIEQLFTQTKVSQQDIIQAKWLKVGVILSFVMTMIYLFLPQVMMPKSVLDFSLYAFIKDPFNKQVTGFTMLGLSLVMLILSLKRLLPAMVPKSFSFWRMFHIVVALALPVLLYLHTGASMGSNLNFIFGFLFVLTLVTGAVSAYVIAKDIVTPASIYRSLKMVLIKVHIFALWFLPVLVGFHILSFYYF